MKIIFLFAILSIYSIDLYSKYILENFELVKSFKIKSNIIKTKDITYQDSNLIYLTKNNIKVFLHNYNSNTLDTFLTLNQFPTDKIDGFDISKDKYLVSLVNYLFVVDKIPID